MITKEEIGGNWTTIVGAVKEKFGQITSDELTGVRQYHEDRFQPSARVNRNCAW